jgi:4-hydroxy-2-oxoheptanedioate aldolase
LHFAIKGRASTLFRGAITVRTNTLQSIWKEGKTAINGWCAIPNAWSAEVMANAGYDSLTLDLQHGLLDYTTAVPMLQAISTTDVIPLARVPWNEPGIIMKLLDAGAYGIICPMINTKDECERFVGACRYAPRGYRSSGPTRASVYARESNYQSYANDTILTFAMVETVEAVQNVEEIVSVPGLNGVYVGPSDLSLSMGDKPHPDLREPKYVAVLDRIVAACKAGGVIAGIHCNSVEYAQFIAGRGFQFVTLRSDGAILATAAGQMVKAMRGEGGASAGDAKLY